MKLRVLLLSIGLVFSTTGVAYADNDYEREGDENTGNGSDDCSGATAPCEDNDFSPAFDKSPVRDSFNPEITFCLPFSRCEVGEE